MASLAATLLRHAGIRSRVVQPVYSSSLSPILTLITYIVYLPIKHRKAILDFCRIQAPVNANTTLSSTFNALEPVHITVDNNYGFHTFIVLSQDLAALLDNIHPFPSLCSFLSYFVRAETTIHKEEFLQEKTLSLDKELSAALYYETIDQRLHYSSVLSGLGTLHLNPQLTESGVSERLRNLWAQGINHILQSLSSSTARPILPKYNMRKNVSYQTIRNYYTYLGHTEDAWEGATNVTSGDLLRLYYKTGYRVPGPIEVRQAWFFNELKPRTYYCLGGDDFFHGLYIQDVANWFVKILPSTNPFTRFTISRLGELNYDELLVTYDYSSFTTSLSELQYFLFWLAESVGDCVVSVLDVRDGIRELSLRSLLHTYNDLVNRHQVFSLERFAEGEASFELRQGRNGSLGVKGNIVFSTTLHGLSLADITGTPDNDCCVGDDALAIIRAYIFKIFIICVNNLGDINPQKFTALSRPSEDESELANAYKFLKRPLTVDYTGKPRLGRLDFFPNFAEVFYPLGDGIHTASPGYSKYEQAKTFAMQWGRYLTLHTHDNELIILARDEDMELIITAIRAAYRILGLPVEGGCPGNFKVYDEEKDETRDGDFFCPPADSSDLFRDHWLIELLSRYSGAIVSEPIRCGGIPPPQQIQYGETFTASSDTGVLSLLEDLDVLESIINLRERIFDWDMMQEVMEKMMNGVSDEPLLKTYTVVDSPPSWYYDVVAFEYPELIMEDPQEAWDRVSSIFS